LIVLNILEQKRLVGFNITGKSALIQTDIPGFAGFAFG
jgi:hypothetical protein